MNGFSSECLADKHKALVIFLLVVAEGEQARLGLRLLLALVLPLLLPVAELVPARGALPLLVGVGLGGAVLARGPCRRLLEDDLSFPYGF